MRFERFAVELKPFRMLRAAALALPMAAAFGLAAPAAAEPTPAYSSTFILNVPPGVNMRFRPFGLFTNAGTNPRFTEATFSVPDENYGISSYYSEYGIRDSDDGIQDGTLLVKAKTSAQLSQISPPPSNPFTVEVSVTMTNDAGQTASGSFTFQTVYDQTAAAAPAFRDPGTVTISPGRSRSYGAAQLFDNPGAGAQITHAVFSATDYYSQHQVLDGRVWMAAKTAAELSALETPPDSPFEVDVTVTMTNDAGQTASGTITFRTTYTRTAPSRARYSGIRGPSPPIPASRWTYSAADLFDNAGAGAEITDSGLLHHGLLHQHHYAWNGRLWVTVKTAAELGALETPPDSPFDVDVTVTMTNDAEQTASGTVTFRTTYTAPATTPAFRDPGTVTADPAPDMTAPRLTKDEAEETKDEVPRFGPNRDRFRALDGGFGTGGDMRAERAWRGSRPSRHRGGRCGPRLRSTITALDYDRVHAVRPAGLQVIPGRTRAMTTASPSCSHDLLQRRRRMRRHERIWTNNRSGRWWRRPWPWRR